MNIQEMKIKSVTELNHLLKESRKKLDDLKFKVVQKQLKNIREIREIKKDIARLLMVLAEAKKQENNESINQKNRKTE